MLDSSNHKFYVQKSTLHSKGNGYHCFPTHLPLSKRTTIIFQEELLGQQTISDVILFLVLALDRGKNYSTFSSTDRRDIFHSILTATSQRVSTHFT